MILSTIFSRPSKPSTASRLNFRPRLEGLEERRVLSATLSGGVLTINQSNLNDTAVVTNSTFFGLPVVKVQETIGGVAQAAKVFYAPAVKSMVYFGNNGDDVFDNQTSVRSTAFGGNGNDRLSGGHSADYLVGGVGNDQIFAREGNDLVLGGAGNDLIRGGQGDDRLYGEAGYDDIFGALGNDYLNGGKDGIADKLAGGPGADTFEAEPYFRRPVFFLASNRDAPQDFNAAEGDTVVGMPAPPVIVMTTI
jgi:Ca2+-binding RTX toxin-like protein